MNGAEFALGLVLVIGVVLGISFLSYMSGRDDEKKSWQKFLVARGLAQWSATDEGEAEFEIIEDDEESEEG
jgi:hypothetical protein